MLLREFIIDGYVVTLSNDADNQYTALVVDSEGEKLFHHDYDDYEKIKEYFNLIASDYENSIINIDRVLDILRVSR